MAYVKVKQIKKTVGKAVDYIVRGAATKGGRYVSSNFDVLPSGRDAQRQFYATSQKKGSGRGGVLAHHVIQSFKHGEVSLEKAHEIGQRLAEQMTGGGRHEYVLATHSDKEHVHNHIIFNPVNLDTGRKFRWEKGSRKRGMESTLASVRKMSDELCRKYGLSIIKPEPTRTRPSREIGEVKAAAEGRSWKAQAADKVAAVLRTATTWPQFTKALEARGIDVQLRGKRTITFATKDETGKVRKVRGAKLGEAYTREAIEAQLGKNKERERKEGPRLMERIQDKLLGRRDNIGDGQGGTRAEPKKADDPKRADDAQRKASMRAERDRRIAAAKARDAKRKGSQEHSRDHERDRGEPHRGR